MLSLSETEQTIIKQMIDELIVNGGILDLQKLHISSNNIDINSLSRIAFQYYRIIREGRVSLDFADIPKYLHLLGQFDSNADQQRRCLSCGSKKAVTASSESSFIPLCDICHNKLDNDLKVISSILRE